MAGRRSELRVISAPGPSGCLLTADGVLDSTTYAQLRDVIIKSALDEPFSVIIDVTGLTVRDESALAIFVAAQWQVAEWPAVPIALVCAHARGQHALRRNGVARYVPVYPTLHAAVTGLSADGLRRYRRRARATLLATKSSSRLCRELTEQWLTAWSRSDFRFAVSIVATELVEDALGDTDSELTLRLETDGSTVTVAVQHTSTAPMRRESISDAISGLDLVAAASRVCGSYTTAAGTTVWAAIGPENRF
jgi:hypothetical protein